MAKPRRKPVKRPAPRPGVVAVNAAGRRIGQDHPCAILTDHEVELLRDLHESHHYGYRKLAKIFNLSRSAVRDICLYLHRAQTAARHKPRCA